MGTGQHRMTTTEREYQLLLHIDTLTTAIEDALSALNERTPNDSRARLLLESAIDDVWETTLGERRFDLIPPPEWWKQPSEDHDA